MGLFEAITRDKDHDGVRIYFATKPKNAENSDRDGFVIIKTIPGSDPNTHVDYFGNRSNNIVRDEVADGGQGNGGTMP